MAASNSYFTRANYRFLPSDHPRRRNDRKSPEIRKTSSRISRKSSSTTAAAANDRIGGPSSLPVNVHDWSKILKDEYRENPRRELPSENQNINRTRRKWKKLSWKNHTMIN
ncbi:hypothetical protein ACS0TY_026164 [Phlomoides rotata]